MSNVLLLGIDILLIGVSDNLQFPENLNLDIN